MGTFQFLGERLSHSVVHLSICIYFWHSSWVSSRAKVRSFSKQQEAKAKGVKFTQDVTNFRPGVRISFLLGPDNVLIELLERKPVK